MRRIYVSGSSGTDVYRRASKKELLVDQGSNSSGGMRGIVSYACECLAA